MQYSKLCLLMVIIVCLSGFVACSGNKVQDISTVDGNVNVIEEQRYTTSVENGVFDYDYIHLRYAIPITFVIDTEYDGV